MIVECYVIEEYNVNESGNFIRLQLNLHFVLSSMLAYEKKIRRYSGSDKDVDVKMNVWCNKKR